MIQAFIIATDCIGDEPFHLQQLTHLQLIGDDVLLYGT